MIVLDASYTLSLFLPDEASEHSVETVRALALQAIAVPAIWPFEIANAIASAVRSGRLPAAEIDEVKLGLEALAIDVAEGGHQSVFDVVLLLAIKHRLSVYDAAYLELAKRTGAHLATLDRKLAAAAGSEGVGLV